MGAGEHNSRVVCFQDMHHGIVVGVPDGELQMQTYIRIKTVSSVLLTVSVLGLLSYSLAADRGHGAHFVRAEALIWCLITVTIVFRILLLEDKEEEDTQPPPLFVHRRVRARGG